MQASNSTKRICCIVADASNDHHQLGNVERGEESLLLLLELVTANARRCCVSVKEMNFLRFEFAIFARPMAEESVDGEEMIGR